MKNTTLQLDNNYNAIVTEEKIRLQDTIYKNNISYKHNDIIFLPSFKVLQETKLTLSKLPTRYKQVSGTKTFKELKDFLLTYNLLQQYFSKHSENKNFIALDSRYLGKALGSRFLNGSNKYFKEMFILKIKGKKSNYTSGFVISKDWIDYVGEYSKVIHKDEIDEITESILKDTYNENKIKNIKDITTKSEILNEIHEDYINIPLKNIELIKDLEWKYPVDTRIILSNYLDGKLYYTKSFKPYGRNYSYIHSLPRELRTALFNGFMEIDLNSAAQSILLQKVIRGTDLELSFLKKYINNKKEIRKELSNELGISLEDVKLLLQIVTFNTRLPTKEQLHHFASYSKFPNAIDNDFIIGLSKDLRDIDSILKERLSKEDEQIIRGLKGRVTAIDIRVYTFQSIESKIMNNIQSMISNDSFHLHDAVYVEKISEDELSNIKKYVLKNHLLVSNIILVFKKYTQKNKIREIFLNSNVTIKCENKLNEYIDFCINKSIEKTKGQTEHHHILPDSLFKEFSVLKCNSWNGVNLSYKNHYIAHSMIISAISSPSMVFAWNSMNNKNVENLRINNPIEIIGSQAYNDLKKEYVKTKNIWDHTEVILEDGTISTNAKEITKKAAITRQNLVEGEDITIQERSNKRCSKTLTEEFILNGEITTISKERVKKRKITITKTQKYYNIYKDNKIVFENMSRQEVIKISQVLLKTDKDNPLGNNNTSRKRFISKGKENLIGLYCIEVI